MMSDFRPPLHSAVELRDHSGLWYSRCICGWQSFSVHEPKDAKELTSGHMREMMSAAKPGWWERLLPWDAEEPRWTM